MKYTVKITQILEGYVDIDADSESAALETADVKYNRNGHGLPDMDDCERLRFAIESGE